MGVDMRAIVFTFIHTRPSTSASTEVLVREFGWKVEQVVFDLIQLGLIYEYQSSNGPGRQRQMFGVSSKWKEVDWQRFDDYF
jgi:hypothetical protein